MVNGLPQMRFGQIMSLIKLFMMQFLHLRLIIEIKNWTKK